MNYLANFNQTWWETCLRDGDSNKGAGPFWGPIRGKMLINLKKSSSHEPVPECIDTWHGTSLVQGDLTLLK